MSDWQPDDVGLYKQHGDGYLMVRDRKDILGLQAGVDGWEEFRVVDDPIEQTPGGGPHEQAL